MLSAAHVVVGVAALKLVWTLAAVLAGEPATSGQAGGLAFGIPATTFLAAAFGGIGGFLLWASPRASRGWWLGGTLLLIAAAFADAVLSRRTLTGAESTLGRALAVDALLPYAWWSFLGQFPRTDDDAGRVVATWMTRVAGVGGIALVATNALSQLGAPGFGSALPLLDRRSGPYLAVVIGLAFAGLLFLWWKSRFARTTEGHRVRVFAAGLALGCGPLLLEVLLSAVSPAFDRWAWRPEVAAVRLPILFVLLAFVPLATAYSVLVDRVVDLRVVLRTAAQYALARYTLMALVSVPFVVLAAYLFKRRGEPLGALFAGPQVVLSIGLIALGVAGLRQRHHWLRALDRRFFRTEADSAVLVTTLVDHARAATTEHELSVFVREDVAGALQIEHATLLIADHGRTALIDPAERVAALGTASNLALLLCGSATPLEVLPPAGETVIGRLPPHERRWLTDGGFEMLVPLRRTPTSLAALLALGPKRSGLAYSAGDRSVLAAVAASVGLALENHRLKSSPSGDDEEPAEECLECGMLLASGAVSCSCGGALAHAPVPLTLRQAFRFERRLGAGGMGVVYRAADLSLKRSVAIKTLPRVSPSRAERLRDEARTMARLEHPHLATIHGVETWRSTPLLVVEFLGGGTLADRLRAGPLALDVVAGLGVHLSDALAHIHDADMVHCDIKPSNIGFTAGGAVKLLDFGLAQWFSAGDLQGTPEPPVTAPADLTSTHTATMSSPSRPASGRFAGTPLYMAPEALEAQRPSPLFDLWSTAVVLYEALAGHHPFAGGTTDQVLGRIRRGQCVGVEALRERHPAVCVEALTRWLSPDRAQRPATAGALREQLRDWQTVAATG
jgi:hypothetical protein